MFCFSSASLYNTVVKTNVQSRKNLSKFRHLFYAVLYPAVSFQHDPNLDLVWSEKLGYILLSIDTVQDCLYGTSIYTDAQKLARRLFEEVVTDVVLECEDCDDVSSIDDEGREEVKRRWRCCWSTRAFVRIFLQETRTNIANKVVYHGERLRLFWQRQNRICPL